MVGETITKEDLQEFRSQLVEDFKSILYQKQTASKGEWLKSYEVRKLLKISPASLQNLRMNGKLPYTKIGSIMLYNTCDIEKLLTQNQINNSKL